MPQPQITVERLDRRRFLVRLGKSVTAITVAGAYVGTLVGCEGQPEAKEGPAERWSSRNALPNVGASVEPVPGTRPELTPIEDHYTTFNFKELPTHSLEDWRLTVGGLVEHPLTWTLDEIKRHEALHEFITLACISNPVGGPLVSTTRWTGTSLQRLLPRWNLKPEATHLRMEGADGFYETVSLETIRADERVMLAYEWDGVPLPMKHGFPLRIFIPSRYGMKQPKALGRKPNCGRPCRISPGSSGGLGAHSKRVSTHSQFAHTMGPAPCRRWSLLRPIRMALRGSTKGGRPSRRQPVLVASGRVRPISWRWPNRPVRS